MQGQRAFLSAFDLGSIWEMSAWISHSSVTECTCSTAL